MKLAIVGTGTMGRIVRDMALQNPGIDQVYSIEPALGESLSDIPQPDVVIDFSHPDALPSIVSYLSAKGGQVGVVFATTGFSKEDADQIRRLSEKVPVIKSSNFSYGINAMGRIVSFAAPLLTGCSDIEIVEKHHRMKTDAPSGTALMLADACDPEERHPRLCGREGETKRRDEIGIHSVRAGTIFGEHSVLFAMKDEVIEIRHTAFSKKIFAKGAIEAALWLQGRKPGFYPIEDVFY
ncbi:4-hydroxy-tetrahydrodipicolinate reductase [Ihubacter sp. rT4E-8]|uniref:4-hydroxy-tetrahydrodipicolinate reductase n=1 Tax=unclassified Ihubacter TaxID=2633299 RepID=UPI003C7B9101